MPSCENCKVKLKENQRICPLCGSIVVNNSEKTKEVFPQIPTIFQQFNLFIRIMILISISAVVISFAANIIFTRNSRWSFIVAAGILCMWISMFFILRKKDNIPKTIIWQVVLVSVLSVLWDRSMGWIGWSIDYVIPFVCIVAMIFLGLSAKMFRVGVRDMVIYLFIDGLLGFVPVIFILSGILHVLYPSVICVASSAIGLSAILLFEWDNIKNELNKRMHI